MTTISDRPMNRHPWVRQGLPFRIRTGASSGFPRPVLEYEGEILMPDGTMKTIVFSRDVGDALDIAEEGCRDRKIYVDPLMHNILLLMKMYWESEDSLLPLRQQCEKLQAGIVSLKAEIKSINALASEARRHAASEEALKQERDQLSAEVINLNAELKSLAAQLSDAKRHVGTSNSTRKKP